MHAERLLLIANLIERYPDQFDMRDGSAVAPSCGTAGCIGGWAAGQMAVHLYWQQGEKYDLDEMDFVEDGREYLGLTESESDQLFFGGKVWCKYARELGLTPQETLRPSVLLKDIKPHHAVTMLRNLASGEWTFPR